ncbi:hypothetical protein [Rathayibacter tritici]|uniref:hypothetical protein n=1 Tax=Rathayibacter tritici TaxID=33888 RepID=UPI000835B2B8|nr:hypothetical protein [Rathayibacter tritici]PPF29439.1 hypothetical protein C5C06_06575 [Rathayibacter tritici]PPI19464.1 hypothetical protein C5D07_01640 [Rathayibacter tritici]PPI49135.1 hypothetical protein C5D18_01780 [Rathayibacter tritici]
MSQTPVTPALGEAPIGLFDSAQWASLGVAAGIVVAGYVYDALYLRPRKGTQFLMLEARDDASTESTG